MKTSHLKDFQKNIDASMEICRDGIDRWLHDQGLHLNDHKKNKLALLLVRYLSEQGDITQERVLNLLGNLGGGEFDIDNIESVEIEIQRLLGHTREETTEKEKAFYRKTAFTEVLLIGLIALGIICIGITQYRFLSKPALETSTPVTQAQMQELHRLLGEVRQLRADLGMQTYSQEEAIRILGSPIGIYDPETITQPQYMQLTGILQNIKIELLKQKQRGQE